MPEKIRWSIDCGDTGMFDISDEQKMLILRADGSGARFVDTGQAIINIAFIRGMVSYVVRDEKLLSGGDRYKETPANLEGMKRLRQIMEEKGFNINK